MVQASVMAFKKKKDFFWVSFWFFLVAALHHGQCSQQPVYFRAVVLCVLVLVTVVDNSLGMGLHPLRWASFETLESRSRPVYESQYSVNFQNHPA